MPFISKVKDSKELSKYYVGFPKGLNTVQDKSLVSNKNLIQATNAMLEVDGVTRRPGSVKMFDEAGASKVYGGIAFYKKSDGTRQHVRIANGYLQYRDDDDSTWTEVTTDSYTSAATSFVQARDKLYIYNGTDNLSYWDGSSINTYTEVSVPTGLTVTATGTTGSTNYSYEITGFNEYGETTASTAVSISDGNEELTTTDYNALDWDDMANAEGYNIYGRHATGWGRVYLATVYESEYNDTGADAETTAKIAPEANNTGGVIGKYGIFSGLGRQFVAGVKEGSTYHPTRLYYSGTVQYVDSFVGAEYGGGWVDINSNDGGEIVDIKPYKSSILVWKTNGVFKVYFTSSGNPAVVEITKAHGGVSFNGSQEIDNDFMYVAQVENRIAVMTIGEQESYSAGSLRTNEISIFYRDDLKGISQTYLSNIASFRFDSKFGFTFTNDGDTENSRGYVIDTRFGGWVYWDGLPMECTQYHVYNDGTNVELYGCSNSDGYMIKLFQTDRNDNDVAFTTTIGTKSFNLEMYDVEKIFRNPTLWFKYIAGGSIDVEVWADSTRKAGTAQLSSSSSGAGVGADLVGFFLPGHTYSSSAETQETSDIPQEIQMMETCRSLGFYLIDDGKNTNWLFMGVHLIAAPLIGKPLKDDYRVQLEA